MLVKDVDENTPLTIAEVREELLEVRRTREKESLGYSMMRALDHVEKFSKLTGEEAVELKEKLEGLEKVSPEIAVKLVDILPSTADEVRAVYAKERFALDQDKVEEILGVIEEYR